MQGSKTWYKVHSAGVKGRTPTHQSNMIILRPVKRKFQQKYTSCMVHGRLGGLHQVLHKTHIREKIFWQMHWRKWDFMHQRPIHKSFWGLPNVFLGCVWNLTLSQSQMEPNQFLKSVPKIKNVYWIHKWQLVGFFQFNNMLMQFLYFFFPSCTYGMQNLPDQGSNW